MSDERYRLVFRGELLEGQHKAVVKKRLAEALKLDENRAQQLFSGKTVIVKRDADTRTAAAYQKLFKTAGARLRVLPVEVAESARGGGGFDVAPVGTPVLDSAQAGRPVSGPAADAADIDTSNLELAEPGALLGSSKSETTQAVEMPDTHRISVADTGVDLSYEDYDLLYEELEIDLDWSLADVGADLIELHLSVEPAIDLDSVNYELAPPGSALGIGAEKRPPPPAPDVSHLSVEELPEMDQDQST